VTIDLDEGAGIGGWDIRPVRHALAAVLRRRPEAYHETLRAHEARGEGDGHGEDGGGGGAPASIHDVVRVKEAGLAARLVYDAHERRSGLLRVLDRDASAADWADARAVDRGDALDRPYALVELADRRVVARREATIDGAAVTVTKTTRIWGDRRAPVLEQTVELEHRGGPTLDVRFGSEWTLTMLGGGGNPSAWWDLGGDRSAHDGAGTATGITTIGQGNDYVGVAVRTDVDVAADAWWAPVETVSNSESGFERVYQGSGLLLSWPVQLAEGERWSRTIRHEVTTSRDRTVEDA
jgi:hypothetical protein